MTPYTDDHRTAAVLFGVILGVWVIGELRQAVRRRPEAERADRWSHLAVRFSLYADFVLAATSRRFAPGATIGGGAVVFGLGFAVAWLGIVVRWSAFVALGRWFTITVMTSADQPVIDTGPCRWLRHPSYTGLIAVLIGWGVMLGNGVGVLALAILPTAGLLLRIRVEEQALTCALGDAYLDFIRDRKRLVPYLW